MPPGGIAIVPAASPVFMTGAIPYTYRQACSSLTLFAQTSCSIAVHKYHVMGLYSVLCLNHHRVTTAILMPLLLNFCHLHALSGCRLPVPHGYKSAGCGGHRGFFTHARWQFHSVHPGCQPAGLLCSALGLTGKVSVGKQYLRVLPSVLHG